MKITILVDIFPKLSETFVLSQVLHFAQLGHEVTVICHSTDKEAALGKPETQILSKVRVLEWPGEVWYSKRFLPWRIRDRLARNTDRRFLNKLQGQEVFLAHFGWQGAYVVRLTRKNAPPLVTIYHGRDVTHEHQRNGLTNYSELFLKGVLHLTVNEPFAKTLVSAGAPPERVKVHHLGVPAGDYPFRAEERPGPIRMISLCRLVEKKGIATAIEALALLAGRHPELDWIYEIAGSGPLEQMLRDKVAALGLEERVCFTGAQPHAEALARIGAAEILLAPSVTARDGDQEGIPVTLMEAMALGTIVCTTRHSGIPELVEHGISGLLADEYDAEELCNNLRDLLEQRVDRCAMARSARSKVETEFEQGARNKMLLEQLTRLRTDQNVNPENWTEVA